LTAHRLPPPTADARLLTWLLEVLRPMSRSQVKELLRDGRIAVNGVRTTRHDHPLRPCDRVTVASDRPAPAGRSGSGLSVSFEDDALIAIDKPPGLLSVATGAEKADTAFARLAAQLAARHAGRPFVVHRLDRDTSGLLVFARSAAVREVLQAGWGDVTKTYLAVVEGTPSRQSGVIETFLTEGRDLRVRPGPGPDAKWAVTRYRLVKAAGRYSLLEVGLETGRKHQIRVHLTGIGCPVIGDSVYGRKADPAGRLGLHAWRLALTHPVTGGRVELESPLPGVLRQVIG
jgi:23S rRNA pseudouridine1911/1915/1917 synthase